MKIATVCSGIGSPEQALKELNIPHEIAFACEIDKYARQTYLANFTPGIMYQDLTAEEWDKPEQYSDLFIGGIPCQAFSLAGKRLGELDKRGLLFYDFYRYVKNQQPKVFIIENVKGLLSDNNGITFQNWCALLGRSMNTHVNMFNHDDSLLYNLHFKVLNSKDFGVPQNRERVFLVGVRNDLPNTFRFPIGQRLTKRLKDILEPEVDEKYYLSDSAIQSIIQNKDNLQKPNINPAIAATLQSPGNSCGTYKGANFIEEPYCVAMRGREPQALTPKRTEFGKQVRKDYEAGNIKTEQKNIQQLEPRTDGVCNTITSVQKDNLIVEPGIINPLKDKTEFGWHFEQNVFDADGITRALKSTDGSGNRQKVIVKEATKQGYAIAKEGDSINLSNPNSETRRGRVGDQIANTLDTACNQGVVVNEPLFNYRSDNPISTEKECFGTLRSNAGGKLQGVGIIHESRIRRLTPLECMRLQGYPDTFVKPCSDSQTYKQAGNSITVNVMKAIIKNIIPIL